MTRNSVPFSAIFSLFFIFTGFTVQGQNELSLQQALQQARQSNPTLKAETFSVSKAQTLITTAKLRPNPVLNNQSLQLMQNGAMAPNTNWYNTQNQQLWWQLTKPIQLPVQRKSKINLAEKSAQFGQNNFAETQRNVFQQVAYKWLDTWTARKHLDLLKLAKSNVDSLVLTNQYRLKNQVITKTELERTELLSRQYEVQIMSLQRLYDNRLNELTFLTGSEAPVQPSEADVMLGDLPQNLQTLLDQSLQNRSDIKTQQTAVEVSEANGKLQKAMAYPIPELGMIYNPQNGIPYLGFYGTIALPVFSRNQGEIQKAKLDRQQADQVLGSLKTQIKTEVTNAFRSFVTQQQNVERYKKLLQQSNAILASVKYAYLKGGTTIIDFLEAQRSWLDTQQNYYDTLQNYRMSYIDLLYYTGTINQIAQ
ncbi:MAG: transporter [Flavobacterium sp. BFFFF2]|nr:MAG: transporter [Flavobacterium sp. BFFFF2]